jgi:hypothetical protein
MAAAPLGSAPLLETATNGDASAVNRDLVRQLGAAVLRRCKSRAEGDALFERLRGERFQEAFAELGVKPCGQSELDTVYNKCTVGWDQLAKSDADFIVSHVLQECENMGQVDDKFRKLQKKVGQRMMAGRGVLTNDVLKNARLRCQKYWSRITPGNVSLIQNQISGKCQSWEDAAKKFDWLWRNGVWEADLKSVVVKGREFTIEDLEHGERLCWKRFGLPGEPKRRKPPKENRPQKVPAVSQAADDATP